MATRNDAAEPARVALLACDAQQSVMSAQSAEQRDAAVYSPYGHRDPGSPVGALGFNGELPESATGHYLLGNGYRAYNPVLMRFNQADSWSPFGAGGLNPYVYCLGDPINRRDPTGHMSWSGTLGMAAFGLSLLTLGASMPLAILASTVGAAATAAEVVESGPGGPAPAVWASIGLGAVSLVAIGGIVAARKRKWLEAILGSDSPPPVVTPVSPPQVSVIQAPLRPSVITRAPVSSPQPPTPPSQVATGTFRPFARITEGRVNDAAMRNAITKLDSAEFVRLAGTRGNRSHGLRLLDEMLPYRAELRNRGVGASRFGPFDLNQLQSYAVQYQNSRLTDFLDGIEPIVRIRR